MTQQLLWHNFTQIDLIPDDGRILLIEVVGSAEVANCHLLRIKQRCRWSGLPKNISLEKLNSKELWLHCAETETVHVGSFDTKTNENFM